MKRERGKNRVFTGQGETFQSPSIDEQLTLSGRSSPRYWSKVRPKQALHASYQSLVVSIASFAGFVCLLFLGSGEVRVVLGAFTLLFGFLYLWAFVSARRFAQAKALEEQEKYRNKRRRKRRRK